MFSAIGRLFDSVLGIVIFILLLPLIIALLPIIAIVALVAFCVNNARNSAISNVLVNASPELQAKLANLEELQLDDNKKQQFINLVEKLKTSQDAAGNKIEINSEIKKELRELRREIKKDFTKQELVTLKNELRQQVRDLGKISGDKNLLFANKKQEKISLIRSAAEKETSHQLFKPKKISLLSEAHQQRKLGLQRG